MTAPLPEWTGARTVRRSDERGIALAVALFALIVIEAVVAGTFLAGRLEQQSGQSSFFAAQASEAAEAGLREAIGTLTPATLQAIPVGATLSLSEVRLGGHAATAREVSRLTNSLFLIRAIGRRDDAAGNQLALRTLGSLVRLAPDSLSGASVVRPIAERSWIQLLR